LNLTQPTSGKTKDEWLKIGNDHWNAKRYNEALTACEQAIRLDPNYALAHFGKGYVLNRLGRYLEAEQAYQQARKIQKS
jgi:superkiller protein 3